MNMLLNVFKTFWNNLMSRLAMPEIVIALIFASVGLAFVIIGKRVAIAVRKKQDIDEKDPIMIGMKATGLVCLLVSLLIIVIRAGV